MENPILSDAQYKDLSKRILHSLESQCRIVPINSLRHSRFYLKKPLLITLETTENEVIASLDDLEAFAHADTEFEAIDQLCEEIVHLYEDLLADRDNLGVLPCKWLQYLEGAIECR